MEISQFPQKIIDAAYEEQTGKTYICVPTLPGQAALSVLNEDGTLATPLWEGVAPFAIESDHRGGLFFLFDATESVARLDLQDGTLAPSFSIGAEFDLLSLKVVSAEDSLLAVNRQARSNRQNSVAVYKGGTVLPIGLPNVLAEIVHPSGQFIYTSRPSELYRLLVQPNGLGFDPPVPLPNNVVPRITIKDEFIIASSGLIFSSDLGSLGSFQGGIYFNPIPYGDPRTNHVHFLSADNVSWHLQTFDFSTRSSIRLSALPSLPASPREFFPLGATDLGFVTDEGDLFLMDLDSIPQTDLAIIIEPSHSPVTLHSNLVFHITVENKGLAPSDEVVVKDRLGFGAIYQSNSVSKGTTELGVAEVLWRVGSLTNGETATMSVHVKASGPGHTWNRAEIRGTGSEVSIANNFTQTTVPITVPVAIPQVEFFLRAVDMVGDPSSGAVFAALPFSETPYSHAVIRFIPATGDLTILATFNHALGKLALSSDGRYLFASYRSQSAFERIDLQNLSATTRIPVEFDLPIGDIDPVPGLPLAVLLSSGNKSLLFDGSLPLPNAGPAGSIVVADSSTAYQYDPQTGELRRLALSSSGIDPQLIPTHPFVGDPQIVYGGGRLVSSSGLVVDPLNGAVVASFDPRLHPVLFGDPQSSRFYLLSHDPVQWTLRSFDFESGNLLGEIPVSGLRDNATNLVRVRSDLLAFRTPAAQLIFLNEAGYPDLDLRVATSFDPDEVRHTSEPFSFEMSVHNDGPQEAENVLVEVTLRGPGSISGLVASHGVAGSYQLTATNSIPRLNVGESATFNVTYTPLSGGIFDLVAEAEIFGSEPDYENNIIPRQEFFISPAVASFQTFHLLANDIAVDPLTTNLLVTTRPATLGPSNSLVLLDTKTFEISTLGVFPAEPSFVTVSPDHPFGIVVVGTQNYPFHTDTLEIGLPVLNNAPPGQLLSVHIAPLQPDRAVFGYHNGMQLFTNLVAVGPRARGGAIAFSPSPDLLFHYEGGAGTFARFQLGEDAITLQAEAQLPFSGPLEILLAGDRIVTSTGQVLDTNSLSMAANLPLPGPGWIAHHSGRLFRLTQAGTRSDLGIFDASFQKIGLRVFYDLPTNPIRLVALDRNRLALLTGRNQIHILNIGEPETVDLALNPVFVSPSATLDHVKGFHYEVRNDGPWSATEALFNWAVPSNFVITRTSSQLGQIQESSNSLVVSYTNLPAGSIDLVEIEGFFTSLSVVQLHATLSSTSEAEISPQNNVLDSTLEVLPQPILTILDSSELEHSPQFAFPLRFTLSHVNPGETYSVDTLITDGTGIAAQLVVGDPARTISITTGSTNYVSTVLMRGNREINPDLTLTLELANPKGVILARDSATLTILDLETPSLVIPNTVFNEPITDSSAIFRISLSRPVTNQIAVEYVVTPGSATSADFALASGTLVLPSPVGLPLQLFADNLVEGDEQFQVSFSSADNIRLPASPITFTIRDSTPPQLFEIINPVLSGDSFSLQIPTSASKQYRLQISPTLAPDSWADVGELIQGDGTPHQFSYPLPPSARHTFFRLLEL